MEKQIIGGFFHILLLTFMAFIYFCCGMGILLAGREMNFGGFFIWILVLIIVMGFLTWLFTKIDEVLSTKQTYVYWGFNFLFSLLLFILGMRRNLSFENQSFLGAFVWHFTLMSFMIPQLDETDYYLNAELTIYDDRITFSSWISKSYTGHCIAKIGIQAIIAAIVAAVYTYCNINILWLVFLIQGGISLVLCIINIKYRFF